MGLRKFLTGLDLGGNKVTNAADPTSAQDLATKHYIDALLGPLALQSLLLSGMTVPTNSLDRWKAGRSMPATRVVGAIASGDTTMIVKDPEIFTNTMHRRLSFESGAALEEFFTVGGEAVTQSLTGVTCNAGTGVFTKTAHGLVVGQRVSVAGGVGTLSFITVGGAYYVNTVPSSSTYTLSTLPGGATLTGTGTDAGVSFTLYGVITLATRGSVNGSAAQAHAAGASIHSPRIKTIVNIGDSIVEGVGGSPSLKRDGWTNRAARMIADGLGGLIGYSWGYWRGVTDAANPEFTFTGSVSQSAFSAAYCVGWEGSFIITGGTGNQMIWTRPAGIEVEAVDVNWVDWATASAAGWSYSLDGGVTWIDNPVASTYTGVGVNQLRRTRIAIPPGTSITDFRVRGATAAGTSKTVVMSNVPLTTWSVYPYDGITEGVHWANLGHAAVKLRSLLNARVVHDAVTDGAGGLTSATAAFVANDVGSYALVNGTLTTISGRTNGTTAATADALPAGSGQRLTILQIPLGDVLAQFVGHHASLFPDLLILGTYTNDMGGTGGNSGGDGDEDFFGDMLQFLITKLKLCADILLISPYEKNPAATSSATQLNYRTKIKAIGAANNVAVLDLYDAMSAYGVTGFTAANAVGYMADDVHLSDLGNFWIANHLRRTMAVL